MVYGEPSIDDFEFIKPITQGKLISFFCCCYKLIINILI